MNKIFKVIWSHASQSFVVVSELTKSKSKQSSTVDSRVQAKQGFVGKLFKLSVIGGALSMLSNTAFAATAQSATVNVNGTPYTVVSGGQDLALSTLTDETVIGRGGSAEGQNTLAIGDGAKVKGRYSIALGSNAEAIRNENFGEGRGVIVIGGKAVVRNIDATTASGRGSMAIGGNSLASFVTPVNGTTSTIDDPDYNTATGGLDSKKVMYRAGIIDDSGNVIGKVQSNEAMALGFDSRAIGDQSIAIGAQVIAGHASVAIGGNDMEVAADKNALNSYKNIVGTDLAPNISRNFWETTYAKKGSVAIGQKSHSNELFGTAIGTTAFVEEGAELGTAIGAGSRVGKQKAGSNDTRGFTSEKSTKGGIAVGAGAIAEGDYTSAIGTGANALNERATAVGYRALAEEMRSLAFGAEAKSFAADAAAIGTGSVVENSGESSIAFGTQTKVSGVKSVALGSNITKLSTNGSVVLGDSSTEVVGSTGASHPVEAITEAKVMTDEGVEVTYSGFAGQPTDSGKYVSIGTVKAERQLKNVAAGHIDSKSTDAINGSQLYSVATVAAKALNPLTFLANTNKATKTSKSLDADGNEVETTIENVGLDRRLGQSIQIIGAKDPVTLVRNEDKAVQSNYSAKNIQTIVDNNGVQIQMAVKPEFEEIKVTDGTNTTTIGNNSIEIGKKDGNKPVKITSGEGDKGGKIENLETVLPENTNAGTQPSNLVKTNAATLGDVLNSGWNLQENTKAKDFVKPYDTVNFVNGKGTTVLVTTSDDGLTNSIKYDVSIDDDTISVNSEGKLVAKQTKVVNGDTTTVQDTGSGIKVEVKTENLATENNKVKAPTDPNALVKASDVAKAINESGWAASVNKTGSGTFEDKQGDNVVNAGDTVTMIAGDNINIVKEGLNYTISTNKDLKADSIEIGAGDKKVKITGGEGDKGGKIVNLETTLTDNKTAGNAPTDVTTTNAATLGDVLNSGWNLKENGNERDFVKSYDTVNFKNGTGTVVSVKTSEDGLTSDIKYDIAIDNETIKVNDEGKLVATQKNVVGGDTTIVTDTKDGFKVEVKTTPLETENNKVKTPTDPNALVKASDIAKVINESGWTASVNKTGTGTFEDKQGDNVVNAGDTVTMIAGDNINIVKEGLNYTVSTNKDLKVNGVEVGSGNKKVTISGGEGDKGGKIENLETTLTDNKTLGEAPKNVVTTNAATLGDVLNAGWNLKENGKEKDFVKPYDKVNFIDGKGTKVSVTTSDDGLSSDIKYDVKVDGKTIYFDDQGNLVAKQTKEVKILEGETTSVSTTDEGTKIEVKTTALEVEGNKVKEPTNSKLLVTAGDVTKAINEAGWIASVNKTGTGTFEDKQGDNVVNAGDTVTMIAGDNINVVKEGLNYTISTNKDITVNSVTAKDKVTVGKDDSIVDLTTSKVTINGEETPALNVNGSAITNVKSNLAPTNSVGDDITKDSPITAEQAEEIKKSSGSNVATVGDVLNAGWTVQGNGESKDFVKPYDKINFVDGEGTTVVVASNGKTTTIRFNVATDDKTTEVNYLDKAGNVLYKQKDGTYNTSRDGKGTVVKDKDIVGSQVVAKTTQLITTNTGEFKAEDPKALVNAGDIAEAINNTGFVLNTTATEGEVSGSNNHKVKQGKTLTLDAGKNIAITQKDGVVSIATKENVEFSSVKVGNVNINKDGINAGNTRITNVSKGIAPTDAVNVSQLKEATNNLDNKINRNTKDLRAGIAGAKATAGLPQVITPGKSMVAVSAGAYKDQSAIAVGYSRASDNGKLILKITGDTNSRGDFGGSVGLGYQW